MMEVNAFWFGFLLGVLAFLFIAIICGMASSKKRQEQEYQTLTLEELRNILKEELSDEEEKR